MREHLERVAGELDEAMVAIAAEAGHAWHPWQHVDWLRLQADLLDRLGAACDGPVTGRAELLRDRAERLADRINRMPVATGTRARRVGPPEQRGHLRAVTQVGQALRPEPPPLP